MTLNEKLEYALNAFFEAKAGDECSCCGNKIDEEGKCGCGPECKHCGGQHDISEAKKKDKHGTFYLTHLAYINNKAHSDLFSIIGNMFINALKIKSLIRIKANFYPNQGQFVEHEYHVDYKFKHIGAIFSLNTCNGYTKLYDGTKIDSVENRLLIFDASTKHCSTNTTNAERRLNINFNYF